MSVNYVADFRNRAFLIKDAEDGQVIHKFSKPYIDLLHRTCSSRWAKGTPCPTNDYLVKKHSCSDAEWDIKRDEVSRLAEPRPGMVRHKRDWVNRYEIYFCNALYSQLQLKR